MIARFCFVRLADGVDRAATVAHLRAVLAAEVAPPAALAPVALGTPADHSARKWDISLVIRCVDLAALAALLARPALVALFEDWLPSRAAVIKAWSFEEV